jgi:two-component system, response regulator PdtaR
MKEEVEDLKETLEARKKIERARAIIMRRSDVDEDKSYRRLRRFAIDGRMKMVEAAQKIIEVESAYGKSS